MSRPAEPLVGAACAHDLFPEPGLAGRFGWRGRMAAIELYTQPGCPYCMRALSLLSSKGVAFREIDARHGTAERAQARERSGGRTTMPQIFIGARHVGGCDDLMVLNRTGELDVLLRAA